MAVNCIRSVGEKYMSICFMRNSELCESDIKVHISDMFLIHLVNAFLKGRSKLNVQGTNANRSSSFGKHSCYTMHLLCVPYGFEIMFV